MDIVDVMLAKAMTPQGQVDTYAKKAKKAADDAEKAKSSADEAIASVEAAAEDIQTAKSEAASLVEDVNKALSDVETAIANMESSFVDMTAVNEEIDKTSLLAEDTDTTESKVTETVLTTPSGKKKRARAQKLYKQSGDNEDGAMTQKAVTELVSTSVENKADKSYVDTKVEEAKSSSGGGVSNLGENSAGHVVVVDKDGNISSGDITEDEIINALLHSGVYTAKNAVGLDVNYTGKSFARTQGAIGLEMGTDFDKYLMYGGRKRCNVADNGVITAFYGDANYKEDGSNGQVMVYQPKFYYQRIPLSIENVAKGQIVRRDSIILSTTEQAGFKLHPIFAVGDGSEYDYVLFSAYEGSMFDGKLASVAGAKPASNMTITEAEEYATARGDGWHILNMAAESAQQMLEIVEFGSMNGQESLEEGISNISGISNVNCASLTGSTASLGNATGHADSTINEANGTETSYSEAGKRAISYRGVENPWGNLWNMIGGANIKGDGKSSGGAVYLCTDFNYTPNEFGDNYEEIGFNLPSTYGWISAMGYGNSKYDWVLMPAECATTANSSLPVGDNLWVVANTTTNRLVVVGGTYEFKESDGPFYYGCDKSFDETSRHNYGARLMYIPTKNSIYEANITKWNNRMGG